MNPGKPGLRCAQQWKVNIGGIECSGQLRESRKERGKNSHPGKPGQRRKGERKGGIIWYNISGECLPSDQSQEGNFWCSIFAPSNPCCNPAPPRFLSKFVLQQDGIQRIVIDKVRDEVRDEVSKGSRSFLLHLRPFAWSAVRQNGSLLLFWLPVREPQGPELVAGRLCCARISAVNSISAVHSFVFRWLHCESTDIQNLLA